jgi:hypothetical protein
MRRAILFGLSVLSLTACGAPTTTLMSHFGPISARLARMRPEGIDAVELARTCSERTTLASPAGSSSLLGVPPGGLCHKRSLVRDNHDRRHVEGEEPKDHGCDLR